MYVLWLQGTHLQNTSCHRSHPHALTDANGRYRQRYPIITGPSRVPSMGGTWSKAETSSTPPNMLIYSQQRT